jgi:hypothetical protein
MLELTQVIKVYVKCRGKVILSATNREGSYHILVQKDANTIEKLVHNLAEAKKYAAFMANRYYRS